MRIIDASGHYAASSLHSEALLSLAGRIGRTDFANAAIDAVCAVLPIDHLSVFDEQDEGAIQCRLAASRLDRGVSSRIADIYAQRFFRQDPFRLAVASYDARAAVTVAHLHPGELRDRRYRAECYERPDIAERITVRSVLNGGANSINLYRARATGPFCEADLISAVTVASLILPALSRHTASLARGGNGRSTLPDISDRLRQLDCGLTRREVEVLARGLIGMTSEGTGLDLGVQVTSVATYRKRAYAKLGISTQAELYGRLLS